MNINFENLQSLLDQSLNQFITDDVKLIINNVNERSYCCRLAIYINQNIKKFDLSGYFTDTEYNRNKGKVKTMINNEMEIIPIHCDLILHSRGENVKKDNLIAIEMKKAYRKEKEKQNDQNRLCILTKTSFNDIYSADNFTKPEHVCGYILGAYIEIDNQKHSYLIKYYNNGNEIKSITNHF